MTRFLKWRKMTWAFALWNGAFLVTILGLVFVGSDPVTGCSVDSAGVQVGSLAKQDCIDAASRGFGVPLVTLFWAVGLVILSVVWFETRPLWRQGHGARLRLMRSEEFSPHRL